ncbi:MAG: hypothetical protein H0T92_11370 [Pyrinomonadaceae bacterium]|nr:hypothetical protein [Pyrinomonadaceae bacterium]
MQVEVDSEWSVVRRLISVVIVLNIIGIVCFCLAAHTHDPLAAHPIAGRGFDYISDPWVLLDSLGFTLMLPGVFFGTTAFLCARVFVWSDHIARATWYATSFVINIILAWKAGKYLNKEDWKCHSARNSR